MSSPYNRKDALYKKAKAEGYRSRAAYKLIEIEEKHHIFSRAKTAVDLGCFPGGWLQVASRYLPKTGLIVGIDLVDCQPLNHLENVTVLKGDIYEDEIRDKIYQLTGRVDLVLSDMSPKISGIRFRDAAESANLVESAFEFANQHLKTGGNIVTKIFPGAESDELFRRYCNCYKKLKRVTLKASRNSSKEFYFVGLSKEADN